MKLKTIYEQKEDKKIYRLYYANITKTLFQDKPKYKEAEVYESIAIPNEMSQEDFFKVISYLFDQVKEFYEDSDEKELIDQLDKTLDTEKYHFIRLDPMEVNYQDIIDVVFIKGKDEYFYIANRSYGNWYKEGITEEEVMDIYDKLGLDIDNLTNIDEVLHKRSINH